MHDGNTTSEIRLSDGVGRVVEAAMVKAPTAADCVPNLVVPIDLRAACSLSYRRTDRTSIQCTDTTSRAARLAWLQHVLSPWSGRDVITCAFGSADSAS